MKGEIDKRPNRSPDGFPNQCIGSKFYSRKLWEVDRFGWDRTFVMSSGSPLRLFCRQNFASDLFTNLRVKDSRLKIPNMGWCHLSFNSKWKECVFYLYCRGNSYNFLCLVHLSLLTDLMLFVSQIQSIIILKTGSQHKMSHPDCLPFPTFSHYQLHYLRLTLSLVGSLTSRTSTSCLRDLQ